VPMRVFDCVYVGIFAFFHGLKKSHLLGACSIHSCQEMEIKFHDELTETVGRMDIVCQELSRTRDDEDFALRSKVQSRAFDHGKLHRR